MTIIEVLNELGIAFALGGEHKNVRHGWTGIQCPYCGSSEYYFGIPPFSRYAASCWRCGKRPLADALAAASGRSLGDVKQLLGHLDRPIAQRLLKPSGRLEMPFGVGPLKAPHLAYLSSRGVTRSDAQIWDLQGLDQDGGRLAWRIFIPIYYRGKIVSWTTRAIGEGATHRYIAARLTQESIPKTKLLYGIDYVRHACIVVEGPADVWKIGPGAVCTFGLAYSREQMMQLSKIPKRIICFDNEPQAQRRARELANNLAPMDGQTMIVQLDSKDAGEATAKEIRRLRRLVAL